MNISERIRPGIEAAEWVCIEVGKLEASYAALKETIERPNEMCPKGQAFKDYVHQRLDGMGVPHSVPESEHDKAGCRIGGRLDHIEEAIKAQGEPVAWTTMPEALDWQFVSGKNNPNGKLSGTWFPLFTSAPTIPEGYALVPDDLLVRVSASLGTFTSDEGQVVMGVAKV